MNIEQYLKSALAKQLPAWESHKKMAPDGRAHKDIQQLDVSQWRQSAVMVAVVGSDISEAKIILTERSSSLRHHTGQISFPGGKIDGDESPEEAALREAWEEIALPPPAVNVVGRLSPLWIPVSGSIVTPVLCWLPALPPLEASPAEVAQILLLDVYDLLGETFLRREEWDFGGGKKMWVPHWTMFSIPLWGATAMILSELRDLWLDNLPSDMLRVS